jgi:MATE family multidrug resistance protein
MEDRAPLLLPRYTSRDGDGREEKCGGGGVRWWRELAREAGKVGYVALPMAAVSVSQYAVQVASNMMVGHLPGVLPLSASAIATSLASVSGFSLLVRFTLSTPCLLISSVFKFVAQSCSLDKRFTVFFSCHVT